MYNVPIIQQYHHRVPKEIWGIMQSKSFPQNDLASSQMIDFLNKQHQGKIIPVPLGINFKGEKIDSAELLEAHTLVAGATRFGKTNLLNTWLLSIGHFTHPTYTRVICFDTKRTSFADLIDVFEVCKKPQEITKKLEELIEEMKERLDILSQKGAPDSIIKFNKIQEELKNKGQENRELKPYIIVVFDEFTDYILMERNRQKGNIEESKAEEMILKLASLGLAAGIVLVFATQYPYAKVFDGIIKGNFTRRICFLLGDEQHIGVAFGTIPKNSHVNPCSLDKGQFYCRGSGGDIEKYKAIFADKKHLSNAVGRWEELGFCWQKTKRKNPKAIPFLARAQLSSSPDEGLLHRL